MFLEHHKEINVGDLIHLNHNNKDFSFKKVFAYKDAKDIKERLLEEGNPVDLQTHVFLNTFCVFLGEESFKINIKVDDGYIFVSELRDFTFYKILYTDGSIYWVHEDSVQVV